MKSYLIDELTRNQVERISASLAERGYQGPIEDIFWIPLPDELLTSEQREHRRACGPFLLSLETGKTWIKLELLVRSSETIRCTCIDYATEEQRAYAQELLETVLREHGITP